jgi:hypothetical protein
VGLWRHPLLPTFQLLEAQTEIVASRIDIPPMGEMVSRRSVVVFRLDLSVEPQLKSDPVVTSHWRLFRSRELPEIYGDGLWNDEGRCE